METYKLHGLPDYLAAIRAFGVTENTSTKNVRRLLVIFKKIIYISHRGKVNINARNSFIPRSAKEITFVELSNMFTGNGHCSKCNKH